MFVHYDSLFGNTITILTFHNYTSRRDGRRDPRSPRDRFSNLFLFRDLLDGYLEFPENY